jgi:hypothetical protein
MILYHNFKLYFYVDVFFINFDISIVKNASVLQIQSEKFMDKSHVKKINFGI